MKCNCKNCNFTQPKFENNCEVYEYVGDCTTFRLQNSIQLLPIKNEDMTTQRQFLKKIYEEYSEFRMACRIINLHNSLDKKDYMNKKHFRDNVIEEFYDCIQIMLQTMVHLGFTVDEIIKGQEKHFEKLEKRGWKFNEH